MGKFILALRSSLVTLGQGRAWLYMLGPAILALSIMIGLSLFLLKRLIALFVTQPPMNWITDWGALWLAKLLAALGGWLLILSAMGCSRHRWRRWLMFTSVLRRYAGCGREPS